MTQIEIRGTSQHQGELIRIDDLGDLQSDPPHSRLRDQIDVAGAAGRHAACAAYSFFGLAPATTAFICCFKALRPAAWVAR